MFAVVRGVANWPRTYEVIGIANVHKEGRPPVWLHAFSSFCSQPKSHPTFKSIAKATIDKLPIRTIKAATCGLGPKMDSSTHQYAEQPQCPLLMLPAELRNTIYELVLHLPPTTGPHDNGDVVHVREDSLEAEMDPDLTFHPSVLSILLTCRQICHEAEQIFYSGNNLRYGVPGFASLRTPPESERLEVESENQFSNLNVENQGGKGFIRSLGPRRQRALHAITISTYFETSLPELTENLPLAANLRVLHLHMPWWSWTGDADAIAWARKARAAIRKVTTIEEVKILNACEHPVHLGSGGASNNSYAAIQEKTMAERACDLRRVVEGMLRRAIED